MEEINKKEGVMEIWTADACGNTFLVLFAPSLKEAKQYLDCVRISDTWNFDSALVLLQSSIASVKMFVVEKDGSVSTMCGNGARAVAHILDIKGLPLTVEIEGHDILFITKVCTGVYRVLLGLPALRVYSFAERFDVDIIHVCGEPHYVVSLQIFNPQQIISVGHTVVPHANCTGFFLEQSFVLRAQTFERGVNGLTASCGTGAVAAAWTASQQGTVSGCYSVRMNNHVLIVQVTKDGATLEGNSVVSFSHLQGVSHEKSTAVSEW